MIAAEVHTATCPETALVEFAAAIRRRVEPGEKAAREGVAHYRSIRSIRWVRIEADAAIDAAMRTSLRGMDAIVVAHAKAAGATLVSLDKEILERAPAVVPTVRPEKILAGS